MKLLVKIIAICLYASYSYGQQTLKLQKVSGAENPNSAVENYYLFKISNATKSSVSFKLMAANTACEDESLKYTNIKHVILDARKAKKLDKITVEANGSLEFFVKTIRPYNAQLDTWNCTKVLAVDSKGNSISNELFIELLIPDSRNDN